MSTAATFVTAPRSLTGLVLRGSSLCACLSRAIAQDLTSRAESLLKDVGELESAVHERETRAAVAKSEVARLRKENEALRSSLGAAAT